MSYFSIRARLIFLAILLLAILAAAIGAPDARARARLRQALADEARLVSVVRSANNASKHFGDLKYWLTDFAATLQAPARNRMPMRPKPQLDRRPQDHRTRRCRRASPASSTTSMRCGN